MQSEDAKAVKKEEVEEDIKSLSDFFWKKPTNANNDGFSTKLKKEEKDNVDYKIIKKEIIDDDKKPVNSSAGISKGLGGQSQTTVRRRGVNLIKDFVYDVKEEFDYGRGKFKKFIMILKDFKAGRFDGASSIARLVKLMEAHVDLLRDFCVIIPQANAILPPKAKRLIALDDHIRRCADQFDGADLMMNKRKTRSQSRREIDAAQVYQN